MKNFTRLIILLISTLFSTSVTAQSRNYSLIYTGNAKGSITLFGNTLMNVVDVTGVNVSKMNDNSVNGESIYGNDRENMQYVDVDGNAEGGSITRNSSTADLILPGGVNTIKLARLYWGGRVKTSDFDLTQAANQNIDIRKGTSAIYTEFTATQIDKNTFLQNNEEYIRYQAFTDITSFIQSNGPGTYSVGNAPLSTGGIDNGGNYGGWCIAVVYENPLLNFNSLRLYDGFEQVFNNGSPLTTSITLTGLNVPAGVLAVTDAKMGVAAWEGDANLAGDFLKINGNLFSNGINLPDNPWNGTISDNGIHVTTKNPNYTNQMGIDIDQFFAGKGYGILPGATSAVLEFGTEADQYFPGLISFVIKSADASLPVSLLYLNGSLLGNNYAKIAWATSQEINCSYFSVERSFDGHSFTAVDTVRGNGTTSSQHNYSIMEDLSNITTPLIYYRLKQVDADGGYSYSKIIALKVDGRAKMLAVSPNPYKNRFDANFSWNRDETAVLQLLDITGKSLLVKKVSLKKGYNTVTINDVWLFAGFYIVQVVSAENKLTGKIIKQ